MTTRPSLRRPALALLGVLALASGALAQGAAAPDPGAATRPPRVADVDKAKTLLHYAVGVGVIALCVGVVVVPGRREHDD